MRQQVLRVLLIEDNPGDAELVKETLSAVGPAAFQIHWTQALLPGLDRLAAGDIDLVLLDMSLPDGPRLGWPEGHPHPCAPSSCGAIDGAG
jgi:CheY-like chemotaxis protein